MRGYRRVAQRGGLPCSLRLSLRGALSRLDVVLGKEIGLPPEKIQLPGMRLQMKPRQEKTTTTTTTATKHQFNGPICQNFGRLFPLKFLNKLRELRRSITNFANTT